MRNTVKTNIKKICKRIFVYLLVFNISFIGCVSHRPEKVDAAAAAAGTALYATYWDLVYSLSSAMNYQINYAPDWETSIEKPGGKYHFNYLVDYIKANIGVLNFCTDAVVNEMLILGNKIKDGEFSLSSDAWNAVDSFFSSNTATSSPLGAWYLSTPNYNSFINKFEDKVASTDFCIPVLFCGTSSTSQSFTICFFKPSSVQSGCTYSFYDTVLTPANSSYQNLSVRYWCSGGNQVIVSGVPFYYTSFSYYFDGTSSSVSRSSYEGQAYYIDGARRLYYDTSSSKYSLFIGYDSIKSFLGSSSSLPLNTVINYSAVAACPEEIPESIPLKKNPAIPDGWRVIEGGNEDDPQNDDNIIPALIPFEIPLPGDSEDPDPSQDPSEDPEPSPDPDENQNNSEQTNPGTGSGTAVEPDPDLDIDLDGIDLNTEGKFDFLLTKFPFCIPYDLFSVIKDWNSELSEPPFFHFEYYMEWVDYTFTFDVDLSDYDEYIQIFRDGVFLIFLISLMLVTGKLIKWV